MNIHGDKPASWYEPESQPDAYPCRDCLAQGCVKCNFIGYRPLTHEEIEQERLENKHPEVS